MRRFLITAPYPVLALAYGISFGLVYGAWTGIEKGDVAAGIATGALSGIAFGLTMALLVRRLHAGVREAVGDASDHTIKAAARAANRGPVPADPDIRRIAVGVAENALRQADRQRWWSMPLLGLFALLALVLAVTGRPWSLLGTALFLGLFALSLWQPIHLRHRLVRLRGAEPA